MDHPHPRTSCIDIAWQSVAQPSDSDASLCVKGGWERLDVRARQVDRYAVRRSARQVDSVGRRVVRAVRVVTRTKRRRRDASRSRGRTSRSQLSFPGPLHGAGRQQPACGRSPRTAAASVSASPHHGLCLLRSCAGSGHGLGRRCGSGWPPRGGWPLLSWRCRLGCAGGGDITGGGV